MTKRKLFSLVSPALCTLLGSLVLFTSLDAKFADLYQKALPGTEVRDDVILVGIDDYAIDVVGSFPFTRDVYADCINVMEEFNASSVVFDLTFLDFSRPSVNENYEPFEPDEVMEASLENSSIDYLSFTFDNSNTPSEYEKEIFVERGLLNNYAEISVINDSSTQEYTGVMPAIPNFLEHAAGAGYVNADPDSDNYYRRVNPVIKYEGGYYGQLTLPALLKKLGNPKIIIDERTVTLKDAHCSGEVKDIVIPRGNDGKVILRYPKMLFDDYNYISIGKIYHVAQLRRWMEEDGEDEYIEEYELLCGQLKEALSDSLCIIGTCASSTSDYGVNLYEAQYPLPGVHYSFANQILNEDFISEIPWYCSVLYAFAVSVLIVFVMNRVNRTGIKIFSGLIMILLSSAVLFAVFWFKRIYSGQAVPLITPFLTYISTVAMGFLAASKDRKFITNAFSQCLSKDVVDQIVANPDSFKLGGESLQMTAIFTDIQKFSSFSELLTAAQLVALLNYYLTKMSDIIMSEGGTIDKYEGDAIIALVGAPLKMDDHAERAVKAALKMKAAEKIMNAEIRKISKEPKPDSMDDNLYSAFKIMVDNNKEIFTRIGINSGEMIAGYMGSENKKNYTMMGNNVNLAARLEGVNKQYSTYGILISEATYKLLDDEIISRRLDKVQVVNVNTPLNLYEPLALSETADQFLIKYSQAWENTMQDFEKGSYKQALEKFRLLLTKKPDDKVCAYYIKLLENFFTNGKTPQEEDDFGVAYNAELKCFRLLSK